jgi:transketolase
MTSADDIATALTEARRFVSPPAQEEITRLVRQRMEKTHESFWASHSEIVAQHPELQKQLENELERDKEADLPKKATKKRTKQ